MNNRETILMLSEGLEINKLKNSGNSLNAQVG